MGGRHGDGAAVEQVLQQCSCQGGALLRVRTRRQLVEQHQRARSGALEQRDHVAQVAAECRQRLLDALLVADVGQNLFEHR